MGHFHLYQWAKEIERQHQDRVELRESLKTEKRAAGGRQLRPMKLTEEEKRKLQAKILENDRRRLRKGTRRK